MVSMVRKPPKKKRALREALSVPESTEAYEKFPWGLRVTLTDEELKKLGIDLKEMTVDEKITFKAETKVVEITQNQRSTDVLGPAYDEGGNRRLELQITGLEIVKPDKGFRLGPLAK